MVCPGYRCFGRHFNPRAPRGARHNGGLTFYQACLFQSTGPSRSPTLLPCLLGHSGDNFNPRAPRGARLRLCCMMSSASVFQSTGPSRSPTKAEAPLTQGLSISIHGPLAEPDSLSRGSSRSRSISIHGPLAEPDPLRRSGCLLLLNFNPRAPRGARQGLSWRP